MSSNDAESAEEPPPSVEEQEMNKKATWLEKLQSSEAALNRTYTTRPKSKEDKALIRLALHRSPFFTCMDEEQIERFIQVAMLKKYKPGELVILEGKIDNDEEEEEEESVVAIERRPTVATVEDVEGEYDDADLNLEEQNPLEEAASALREEDESASTSVNVKEKEEAPVSADLTVKMDEEDYDETFSDEPDHHQQDEAQPDHHQQALEIVAAVANAEDVPLDIEELSQSAKEKRETLSGMQSFVYTVRSGRADVWHENFNTSSLGPGHVFGEGGFLFHRQHSASVVASPSTELECWAVPINVFMSYVLPSPQMMNMFVKYASHENESGLPYMSMDDFVQCVCDREGTSDDKTAASRVANTYSILRKTEGLQKINLSDFCLFYLLMSRPDPEVDIAFLLMDKSRTGTITIDDFKTFLELHEGASHFNVDCDFVRRHFGKDGKRSIRPNVFPQFLQDFQREMGRQAFLYDVDVNGTPEGYLAPTHFVNVLKTACGWRLPDGVVERLESIYCRAPFEAAEAAALVSVTAEKLKGSSAKEAASRTSASILAHMEQRTKNLGDRYFTYADFLAFQEVLVQLPGICNLIRGACDIKKGPVSPDDFKVANRVIGLGGKLSRRQVDIIFQLFDLDRDGYLSPEDVSSVVGLDFVQRLEAVKGRGGQFTFAPPPDFSDAISDGVIIHAEKSATELFINFLKNFGLAGIAGGIGATAVYPIDLVKTRMQNQRIGSDGKKM